MKHRWNKALALLLALMLTIVAVAIAEEATIASDADEESVEIMEIESTIEAAGIESEVEEAGEIMLDDLADILAEDTPISEEPSGGNATEEPAAEESTTEEPVTEEPAAEKSATEEPVAEESVDEERITEEPITEEPVAEEPAIEEPAEESAQDDEPQEVPVPVFPTANELTYTGEAQALVSGEGWLYSLDGESYSAEAPTAINAGEYTVYFIPADTVEAEPQALTVTVAKADVVFIPPVAVTRLD